MAETLFFNALRAAIDEEMARDFWFDYCFGDQYPGQFLSKSLELLFYR